MEEFFMLSQAGLPASMGKEVWNAKTGGEVVGAFDDFKF